MEFGIEQTKNATSTAIFQEKFARLRNMAPEIYNALGINPDQPNDKPTMQFVDGTIVAAKGNLSAVSTYDDIFALDDDIQRPGASDTEITDLNEGKLPKNHFFMTTSVQLLHASSIDGSSNKIGDADWGIIPAKLRNGTIEIEQNGRIILPKMSMEKFFNPHQWVQTASDDQTFDATNTFTLTAIGDGIFEFDNPKVLYPDEKIDVNLRFGSALTDNDAIKVVFRGVKTYRV